jgi:hypothetical protein
LGDSQNTSGPPSSEHWKLTPASFALNSNVALVLVVSAGGPDSIVVTGAVRWPIAHSYSAGVGSTVPAASLARTSSRCSPSSRPL